MKDNIAGVFITIKIGIVVYVLFALHSMGVAGVVLGAKMKKNVINV